MQVFTFCIFLFSKGGFFVLSIQKLLTRTLVAVFIAIITLLSVFYYGVTRDVILTTLSQSRQDSLSQISGEVDTILDSAYTISYLIAQDEKIHGTILSDDISLINQGTVNAHFSDIYSRYYSAFEKIGVYFHIICLAQNGFVYSSQSGFSASDYERIRSYAWFSKNIGLQSDQYLVDSLPDSSSGDHGTSVAVVRNFFGSSGQYKGSLIVCIPEKILGQSYSNLDTSSEFYILNPLSVAVSASDKSVLGTIPLDMSNYRFVNSNRPYSIIVLDKTPYFSAKYTSEQTGWIVFERIPLSSVLAPMRLITLKTILLASLAVILSVPAAIFLSRKISRPLMQFCNAMNQAVSSRFKPLDSASHILEIRTLTDGFNQMTEEISHLMKDIEQKEKDINTANFNFLRAQINPHFLYNTLFSIKCTVSAGQSEQACQMISILISLLRNSISTDQRTASLLSETNLITKYVKLQNLRYQNTIILKIESPTELMELTMPRFLLQPLVENALMYSSATSSQDSRLREIFIEFFLCENSLHVEVCNNGSCFTAQDLAAVLHADDISSCPHSSHIGLKNIQRRIQLLCGEGYGLYIGQRQNYSTVVGIRLPLIAEQERE